MAEDDGNGIDLSDHLRATGYAVLRILGGGVVAVTSLLVGNFLFALAEVLGRPDPSESGGAARVVGLIFDGLEIFLAVGMAVYFAIHTCYEIRDLLRYLRK